jgi:hypothetical protein
MICLPCRQSVHTQCPGNTWCDCQHYPRGSMVNWGKINGDQESAAGDGTESPDRSGDSSHGPPVHAVDQESEGAR